MCVESTRSCLLREQLNEWLRVTLLNADVCRSQCPCHLVVVCCRGIVLLIVKCFTLELHICTEYFVLVAAFINYDWLEKQTAYLVVHKSWSELVQQNKQLSLIILICR